MAAVQPIRKQSYEQIYELLKSAIFQKRCVSARYNGFQRHLCPHILGRTKDNTPQVLAYQYGGQSKSGLGPPGSPDNWRCVAVEKLSDVRLTDDQWINPPNHSRMQSCIAHVEFDANLLKTIGKGAGK